MLARFRRSTLPSMFDGTTTIQSGAWHGAQRAVLLMKEAAVEAVQQATQVANGEAPAIDHAGAEAFGARMVGVLNDACLALMTSIGHQVGLFDTLAGLPPATSSQIADAADLQERYTREWLAAMTTSGVVEYDPATTTYRLPPEHAASLTRAAGPDNLAGTTQFIPLLAGVEAPLIACFRAGAEFPTPSTRGSTG